LCDVGYDLRSNPFKERGDNENQHKSLKDPLEVLIWLIARSRTKKIKKASNGLIQDIRVKSSIKITTNDD
jgi:hypothetical protein